MNVEDRQRGEINEFETGVLRSGLEKHGREPGCVYRGHVRSVRPGRPGAGQGTATRSLAASRVPRVWIGQGTLNRWASIAPREEQVVDAKWIWAGRSVMKRLPRPCLAH